MSSNFGYHDFLLVRARKPDVLEGILQDIEDQESVEFSFDPKRGRPRWWVRFLLRCIGLKYTPVPDNLTRNNIPQKELAVTQPFTLHANDTAEPARLIVRNKDMADDTIIDDIRISIVSGHPEWTLIEYSEFANGVSSRGIGLSEYLSETEVFYFRRSGRQAKNSQYDFHIYQDGEITRRALSHRSAGRALAKAQLEEVNEGAPTAYEPKASARGHVMTAKKQEQILKKIGFSLNDLFGPKAKRSPTLISRKPGGAPITENAA